MAAIVLLSALFFTSVVMCGAMTIAWASFGHTRHARSWAIAFGIGAVQSLVNAVAVEVGRPVPLMMLAFVLIVLPSPLVAIGARERVRLPSYKARFAAAVALAASIVVLGYVVPALQALALASATLFSAGCLLIAARSIRPAARPPEAAERAMHAALILLASVEAITGLATWATLAMPDAPYVTGLYHGVLALAIPPATLCSGVAAVLLVASDLAVELGWQAARDPLTCVFNRRGFQEGTTRALANARRLRVPMAVVLADIDHFKAVNDRYGHLAGDATLCFIAARLEQGVRQGDIVARIGGEEFAMLLVDSSDAQARDVIERIRIAIATGFEADDAPTSVTVSFGIGAIAYDDGPLDRLLTSALDRADRALYLSKVEGRNRVTVAASRRRGAKGNNGWMSGSARMSSTSPSGRATSAATSCAGRAYSTSAAATC